MKKSKKQLLDEKEVYLIQKGKEYSNLLKKNATIWENKFFKILKNLGYNFKFQVPVIYKQTNLYIIDFLLTDSNIFIELDGKHHYTKENIKKDNLRTKRLKKLGFTPIRFSNKQIDQLSELDIKNIIEIKINSNYC